MLGEGEDSTERTRAQLASPRTVKELLRIALKRTGDAAKAKDLAQDAVKFVLARPDRAWDGRGTFLGFMRCAMRHVRDEQLRRRAAHEVPVDPAHFDGAAQDGPPAPDVLLEHKRAAEHVEELHQRLVTALERDDPKLARAFAMLLDGTSVEQQATELGESVAWVYEARRRIGRRAAGIEEDDALARERALRARRDVARSRMEAER